MMKMDLPQGMQQPAQPRTRLVQARTRLKLSQKQVADRIGTTFVNVSRWERGITKPSPYFRRRLVQLYGRTEEELELALSPDAQPSSPASDAPSLQTFSTTTDTISATPIAPISDPSIPLPPANPLVGRDNLLAELKQRLLSGGNVTLTALNGLPGVGKTTLAITIAHDADIQAHFRDGILWAGLGPQPNMYGVMSHWGGLLGIPQAEIGALNNAEAWAVALRRSIGSRSMLLVIDDAWRVENALALKVGGPNSAYLITTRYPSIASQFGAGSAITIRELEEEESVVLLRMLAPQIMQREDQRAHELARSVGGLPLALTLVGNYLRRHAYSGQPRRAEAALARLSDAVERLHISEPRGPAERHPSLPPDTPVSLQSVIAVTDSQLTPDQQAAFRALSVFPPKPGSFTEVTALAVAGCPIGTLDFLVDVGLLECSETGHYTMHQTIADYARSHLDDDAPYVRLVDYMATFVPNNRKNYALLEQESSSILAALEVAYRLNKTDALMRCIYAYIPYLLSRGLYSLAETHLLHAREVAECSNDACGKAGALLYLGEIAQKQSNYEQASAFLREGLELARQAGEQERITALLADIGYVTWKRGEYNQAEGYLNEGLARAREIDDKEHISDILDTLGSVAASRGEYDKSMEYMEEALEVARELDDDEKICTLLINLGVTEGERGDYERAKEDFLEALKIARQIGHKEWISLLLSNLGEALSEMGDYVQAETYFKEGLALVQQIGHREWTSALLSNLGLTMRKQGNYTKAKLYIQESLELARLIKRPLAISNALYEYGILHIFEQQIEDAREKFLEMKSIIPDGDPELTALADYGLARVAAAQGLFSEALKLGRSSMIVLETMGNRNRSEVRNWLETIEIA